MNDLVSVHLLIFLFGIFFMSLHHPQKIQRLISRITSYHSHFISLLKFKWLELLPETETIAYRLDFIKLSLIQLLQRLYLLLVGSSSHLPCTTNHPIIRIVWYLVIMAKKKDDCNLLPIAEDYFNTIFSEVTEMKALVLDS